MGGQFRENWKRLTDKLPASNTSSDNKDLVRFEDSTNASGLVGFPINGSPSLNDILKFDGSAWVPGPDASGIAASIVNTIGVSVGASGTAGTPGTDYATLGAALSARQTNITVVSDTLETGPILVTHASGNSIDIKIINGAIVNMRTNVMQLHTASGPGIPRITGNGKIHWDSVLVDDGLRVDSMIIEGITLESDDVSVSNGIMDIVAGTVKMNNVRIRLPRNRGIRIGANSKLFLNNVEFEGRDVGGLVSDRAIDFGANTSLAYLSNVIFTGQLRSAAQPINAAGIGRYVINGLDFVAFIPPGTINFGINSNCFISNLQNNGGALTWNAGNNIRNLKFSNCDFGATSMGGVDLIDCQFINVAVSGDSNGILPQGAGSRDNSYTNCLLGTQTLDEARLTGKNTLFTNCTFGGTNVDIEGSGLLFIGCKFNTGVTLLAQSSGCMISSSIGDSTPDDQGTDNIVTSFLVR